MKKTLYRALSLALAALMLVGSTVLFSAAADLPDDHPDVRLVGDEVEFLAALNEAYENRVIRLTSNITLSDWLPFDLRIGDSVAKRNFALEGKGHVITLNVKQEDAVYAGLFGRVESANIAISQLGIINRGISVSGTTEDPFRAIGKL